MIGRGWNGQTSASLAGPVRILKMWFRTWLRLERSTGRLHSELASWFGFKSFFNVDRPDLRDVVIGDMMRELGCHTRMI